MYNLIFWVLSCTILRHWNLGDERTIWHLLLPAFPSPLPPLPTPPQSLTSNPPRNPSPQSTVSAHITLLHRYNEIKDVGQGLMGMIAERRGVRIGEVGREFGVGGE